MHDAGSLLRKLNTVPSGKIEERAKDEILALLASCWHQLRGAEETAMAAGKLSRAEELSWNPPILSFIIERHGAAAMGSSRGELQHWRVDLREQIAQSQEWGYRQLRPPAPRLDVSPIAERVIKAVLEGPGSDCDLVKQGILVWTGDRISIRHGELVSGGNQQTIAGRRKRFRGEMEEQMKAIGWMLESVHRGMQFRKSS